MSEVDPHLLGVHPSIKTTWGKSDISGALSQYVIRDHDEELNSVVAEARTMARFVLLVGGSSTGKTRSAAECVITGLPDWQIVVPLTLSRLRSAFEEHSDWENTVLWLNELQTFVSDGGDDEIVASLNELLDCGKPCLVIGTLWPDYAKEYMRGPSHRKDKQGPSNALQALFRQATIVHVASRFSDREMSRAVEISERDAAIKTVLTTAEGREGTVTQNLAAGPDLIRHWQMAPDTFTRKLIVAATDARLLGVNSSLTEASLRGLTVALLDPNEKARALLQKDWFESAMSFAIETLRGASSILIPTVTEADEIGYVLADYVYQKLLKDRTLLSIDASYWKALQGIEFDNEEAYRIARTATRRGDTEAAEIFYRKSIELGNASASTALAKLLAAQLRLDEAERVYADTFASNPAVIWIEYSRFLRSHDRPDECEAVLRRAIEADVPSFPGGQWSSRFLPKGHHGPSLGWAIHIDLFGPDSELTELLHSMGRGHEIISVWRDAVSRGRPYARLHLAEALSDSTEGIEEAERILREETDIGTPSARYALTRFLDKKGRTGAVLRTWQDGAAKGEPEAARIYASILEARSRFTEAEDTLRDAVISKIPLASENLSEFLRRQDRESEAFDVLLLARNAGTTSVLIPLAKLAVRRDNLELAESLLKDAVRHREEDAWKILTRLIFEIRGMTEEVASLLAKESALRTRSAAGCLMRFRMVQDRIEDAAAAWHDILPFENHHDTLGLAGVAAWTGDFATAESELRAAVANGVLHSEETLVRFLHCRGESSKIESVWRLAISAGNDHGRQELAKLLIGLGRHMEAEELLKESIDAGELNSGQALGRFLLEQGRQDEAFAVMQAALERGEGTVASILFHMHIDNGQLDEAKEFAVRNRSFLFEFNSSIAWLEEKRGNIDEAEDLLYRALEIGEWSAEENLNSFLNRTGRARHEPDDASLSTRKVRELEQRGSIFEAQYLQHKITEKERSANRGVHSPEAERNLRERVRQGEWKSVDYLVAYLLEEKRIDEAIKLAQQGVALGVFESFAIFSRALLAANRKPEAIRCLWAGIATGERGAAAVLRTLT